MKKIIFSVYSVIILLLLARAEYQTLPLLSANGSYAGTPMPIQGATLIYEASPLKQDEIESVYRENLSRQGFIKSESTFYPFQLLWRVPKLNNAIHGASKSSPAVTKEDFFIADDSGYLRAYSGDGQINWEFYTGISSRGMHATPVVSSDSVYIGDYAGYFYALNRKTGTVRWLTKTGVAVGSSALLYKNKIYVGVELDGPDGFLLALDAQNGQWLWTSSYAGNHPHSSPALSIENELLLMGSNTGAMIAYDLNTGNKKWSFQTGSDIKCAAAISNNTAYFTSWDEHLYAVRVGDGNLQWKLRLDGRAMNCPSVNESGDIVIASGHYSHYAVNAQNGDVLWRFEIPHQEKLVLSSPLIISFRGQEVAPLICDETQICLFDITTKKILQRIEMGGTLTSSPVFRNGKLYLATLGNEGLLIFDQSIEYPTNHRE